MIEDASTPFSVEFAKKRSVFEGEESDSVQIIEPQVARKISFPVGRVGYWSRLRQFWLSKWPGWPGFWQSRFSGWPVAFIFALYVYYLLVFVLLSTNPVEQVKKKAIEGPINATLISQINEGIMDCGAQNYGNQTKEINNTAMEALLWENQKIGMYSAGATFVAFASGSYASTYVRCYMLLIVPGLFAGRGRALLMTISVGLLLDGPIANLNTNIQLVSNSFVCMYEQMQVLACKYKASFSHIFDKLIDNLEKIHQETEERMTQLAQNCSSYLEEANRIKNETEQKLIKVQEEINEVKQKTEQVKSDTCSGWQFGDIMQNAAYTFGLAGKPHRLLQCDNIKSLKRMMPDVSKYASVENNLEELVSWVKKLHPDMDPLGINKNNIGDLLQGQSIESIRGKLISSSQHFFDVLMYIFSHIKVGFYLLSLLYMLYQANSYLVKYLSDDAFDNMFVNGTLDEGFSEKLLPLRKWESKEKYQMTSTKKCMKLSSKEYKKIGLLVIPPLLFTIATIAIISGDQLFASFIDVMKEHGKFGITFTGMNHGIELNGLLNEVENGTIPMLDLQLEAFDLSTDPCLPVPVKTDWKKLLPLILLVTISLVTCFMDAYLSRLRSQICNLFYPERAKRRTLYLRKKIITGRGKRFYQMKLVATQRKRKHDELLKNSYWYRFEFWFDYSFWSPSETMCHGCDKEVKKKDIHIMNFEDVGVFICKDCMKDVDQRAFY